GHDHGPCLAENLARAESAFREKGMTLTSLRRRVLMEVAASHKAMGAYEILDRLAQKHGRRLAPISVYRALDALLETGLVHRLESRNAFFACHAEHERGGAEHRAVLLCERCGTVAEIDGRDVIRSVAGDARKLGFRSRLATIEILGQCRQCQDGDE
ncbi:MAG: Fur family transcriptional regulator, partial [Hyphomicrobiaceae bacterium]